MKYGYTSWVAFALKTIWLSKRPHAFSLEQIKHRQLKYPETLGTKYQMLKAKDFKRVKIEKIHA